MQKNKKRICGECPECQLGPKTKCFWQIEKSVPEHFKPSMIGAFVSVEEVDGMGYLKATEMDKAFARVVKAIETKEKIVVFGDYDVDGTSSVALLYRAFGFLGINPPIFKSSKGTAPYLIRAL